MHDASRHTFRSPAMSAMDVDPQPAGEQASTAPRVSFSLDLLQVIKQAQALNGLKHDDYGRYRQYCARRLRSLYTSLKFLHGKGRYTKKKLDNVVAGDVRYLQVPLVSAERAWAYALELKKVADEETNNRARHHAMQRMCKAAFWASELLRLLRDVGDDRSQLEGEAYASWMAGNAAFIKDGAWEEASAHYGKARKLFAELAKLGSLEAQALCAGMVQDCDQALRFCQYKGAAAPGQGGPGAGRAGSGSLDLQAQSKIANLTQQQATSSGGAAEAASSFEWRGTTYPVRHERVRAALATAKDLAGAIPSSSSSGSVEEQLVAYDKLINAYHEVRAVLRAQLRAAQGEGGSEGEVEELRGLERGVVGAQLEATLERGLVQLADTSRRWEATQRAALSGARSRERPTKPEDLTRLHEALMYNSNELAELAGSLKGRAGEALADVAAARSAAAAAGRCYWVAHTYLAGDRWGEAAALFGRAQERVAEAVEKLEELPPKEAAARGLLPGLAALEKAAQAYLLVAAAEGRAEGARERDAARQGLDALNLAAGAAGSSGQAPSGQLLDHLEAWESFAGVNGKGAKLYAGPYGLRPMPARPIMLDTAAAAVDYPDLSHRLKAAEPAAGASGLVGRLFGAWGSSSGR